MRAAALANQPWRFSTGPRTVEGKARSAANGKRRQKGAKSVREVRAELTEFSQLISQMRGGRTRLAGRGIQRA